MSLPALDPSTRNLVDGRLVAASDGGTFPNVNPATEEVLGETANGTRDDMERAIAAARRAFDTTSWSQDPLVFTRAVPGTASRSKTSSRWLHPSPSVSIQLSPKAERT